jgi:hypothetical protein
VSADPAADRVLRLEVSLESDDDLDVLEGALLAARASELSQARRRGARHAFGYGSESARETMSDEVDLAQRRWELLDRLLRAIRKASRSAE